MIKITELNLLKKWTDEEIEFLKNNALKIGDNFSKKWTDEEVNSIKK
ncbi:MAG: hypothetical protein ACRC51_08920 [Cetobacterium sp.]